MADIDLNEADEEILDVLQDGRNTPSILADWLGYSREYVAQRLRRLVEHGEVEKIGRGLYGHPELEAEREAASAAEYTDTPENGESRPRGTASSGPEPRGERTENRSADDADHGGDVEAVQDGPDIERALDEVAEEAMPGSGEKQEQRREALRAAYEFLRDADGVVTPKKFQQEVYPGHEAGYIEGSDPPYSWWTNCIYGGLKALAEYDDRIVVPDTTGEWEYRD